MAQPGPYISPWGRVGEMVVAVWPLVDVRRPPKLKGKTKTPQPKVWSGVAEGDSGAFADRFISGRIGVPDRDVRPVRLGGVVGASWSEDADTTSISINVTFHDPYGNIKDLTRNGTWMYLALPMDGHVWEIGLFYIWERETTDTRKKEVTVTAFDICSRLNHVGKEDKIYRNMTAPEIASKICRRFEIPLTFVDRSRAKIKILQIQGLSPYEQIVEAYKVDTAMTGRRWRIRALGDGIWIYEVLEGKIDRSQPNGSFLYIETGAGGSLGNMISGRLRESLDGKRTVAIARGARRVGTDTAFRFPVAVARSSDGAKFGPLVEHLDLTQAGNLSEAQLRGHVKRALATFSDLTRAGTYEVPGHPLIRAGHWIGVQDDEGTGLYGRFYISRITHTVSGSTMRSIIEVSPHIRAPKIKTELARDFAPVGTLSKRSGGVIWDWDKVTIGSGGGGPPAWNAPPGPAGPGGVDGPGGLGAAGAAGAGATGPGAGSFPRSDAGMAKLIDDYIAGTAWRGGGRRRSPLEGMGAEIVRECAGKMDPRFIVAIGVAENHLGTVGGAPHNTWGMGPGIAYPSWSAGLKAAIGNLVRPGGYYVGRNTIAQIGARWAPSGAGNDPNGLNNNWVRNVTKAMGQMGASARSDTTVKWKPV